jgi:predicted nuclease of predicted toxin-antitoxin system
MRVLLDECLPKRLGRLLSGHQVVTVPQAGLSGLKNGALLAQAAGRFDVLVTIDQSMPSQQNLQAGGLALVMLVAISNRLEHLTPLVTELLAILPTVVPGQVYRIPQSSTP